MPPNHNVSHRELRKELRQAGWWLEKEVGQYEIWRGPNGNIVSFKSRVGFGPKQVATVRKAIIEDGPGPVEPAELQPTIDTELIGPALPEEGAVFEALEGFAPPLPPGTPVIVLRLDPVTVDVPTLQQREVIVIRWVARVPDRLDPIAPISRRDSRADPAAALREPGPDPEPELQIPPELLRTLKLDTGATLPDVVARCRGLLSTQIELRKLAVEAGAPSNAPVREAIRWLLSALERSREETQEAIRGCGRAESTLANIELVLTELSVPNSGDGLVGRIRRLAQRKASPSKASVDKSHISALERQVEDLQRELDTARAELASTRQDVREANARAAAAPSAVPGQIPNWSDERIETLARRLGMIDVLRWMLGRAPNREDMIAAALGALEDRLGGSS